MARPAMPGETAEDMPPFSIAIPVYEHGGLALFGEGGAIIGWRVWVDVPHYWTGFLDNSPTTKFLDDRPKTQRLRIPIMQESDLGVVFGSTAYFPSLERARKTAWGVYKRDEEWQGAFNELNTP